MITIQREIQRHPWWPIHLCIVPKESGVELVLWIGRWWRLYIRRRSTATLTKVREQDAQAHRWICDAAWIANLYV